MLTLSMYVSCPVLASSLYDVRYPVAFGTAWSLAPSTMSVFKVHMLAL